MIELSPQGLELTQIIPWHDALGHLGNAWAGTVGLD
jgi:hypothetical protein